MTVIRLRLPAPEWQNNGLCQQFDPDSFYPERGYSADYAKSICHRCPVKTDCRNWALDNYERHGVWGGLSEKEREAIWKQRKQQAVAA